MSDERTAMIVLVSTCADSRWISHRTGYLSRLQYRHIIQKATAHLSTTFYSPLGNIQLIAMVLFCILASRGMVWSGSKYVFPGLSEKDLPFYVDKREQAVDPHLYLYSSLSLLGLNTTSIVFNISQYRFDHVYPWIVMNIYPDTDQHMQSEYFDFTIWGQLGNFFNKNIEMLKIENEIIEILNKIEEVNRKYKELIESKIIHKIEVDKIITFNKMNFIDSQKDGDIEKISRKQQGSVQSEAGDGIQDPAAMIQMYESEYGRGRLRGDIHFHTLKGGMAGPGIYEAADARSVNTSKKLEAEEPELDSIPLWLFYKVTVLIKYLENNKLESLVYLSLLLLLTTFIKVLFTR
jgi:hypothetical protein